jgi:hypothetical protein
MTIQSAARKSRRLAAAAVVAGVAALSIAGPAQADLTGGVTNGGCITGIQVGHVTHANGDVTPICHTFN